MAEAKTYRILAINPGSTSTKVAVFENENEAASDVVRHSRQELDDCGSIAEQEGLRSRVIREMLEGMGQALSFDAIVGRGGLVEPIDSGTYRINERMLKDLHTATATVHASALGAILAAKLGEKLGVPSFVVDPIVVDEMGQYARLTGIPGIERRSVFHALNQKAIARRCARDMGKLYEDCRFIVAHMGGGITVGAHRYGRVIDVNDALSGEGPFTPERSGYVPALQLIHMCFSGGYTERELIEKITTKGGMHAYLGTNDLRKCERLIREGDEFAALVLESMAYQVSKQIGMMFAALQGRCDAIVLTGGLAYSQRFTGSIKQHVSLIAPVKVYPGEDEMRSLAEGALRVLRGEERLLEYAG